MSDAYLLKTEPDAYSIADLERDNETLWDGVTNPQAVKNLREMKKGALLIIYHTGDERAAVGTARALSIDATDPKVPKVSIKFGTKIKTPKTLTDVKAAKLFEGSPLLNQGRLSVVPLTQAQYDWFTGD